MAETEVRSHSARWRTKFEVGSTLVMIALAAVLVWQGLARFSTSSAPQPHIQIPTEPIPIGNSAIRGVLSAPVAIIEYADFECGSCAQFARVIEPLLLREYVDKGRVVIVFKHFPLQSHPGAKGAAKVAWCAAQQGKFWEMRDRLFRMQGGLQDSEIQAAGKAIGLDMARFDFCRASPEVDHGVQLDRAEGEKLKIPGTPTFFLGRVMPDHRVQVTDAFAGSNSIQGLERALRRFFGK